MMAADDIYDLRDLAQTYRAVSEQTPADGRLAQARKVTKVILAWGPFCLHTTLPP